MKTPRRSAGALVLAALLLAGCSQTAALAPVGGNRLSEVRFAANDVLVAQSIQILTAPVCTASGADDATISCTGETTDQQTITVTSKATDQKNMDVTVGSRSIYHGSVMDVLNANARPSS